MDCQMVMGTIRMSGNLSCNCQFKHACRTIVPLDADAESMSFPLAGEDLMDEQQQPTKGEEIRAFLLLTAVTAPVLAIGVVGGYGFFVWMFQMFTGRLPGAY
jgi:periplasmic nitrate reductase NapE